MYATYSMAILGDRERKYLRSKFEKELSGRVRLIVFTQEFECEYCAEVRSLAEEIAELDNRISAEVYDFQSDKELAERLKVDKIPALLVFGEKEYGVRFFGIPSGYEFMTLVDDIIYVSRGSSNLPAPLKEKVKQIDRPVHIQVFVTPTCPYCPIAVRTAHQMAIENTNITSDMIEVLEFPHLAHRYQVMAVPKIVINDRISFEGALPEALFVEHVLAALRG
ncbi:MAG: thioredoxin family protein [Thaumarchaeota archaeon]|jgi:glutaredoxin-like protein|nr:thioredoxin family protein [Candidatus Wolframiiraptor allenii]